MIRLIPIVLVTVCASKQDYCSLHCDGKINTMCKHPKDEAGPQCRNSLENSFTSVMQTEILDWHNNFRNKFAEGSVPYQTLPGAADMRMLSWDDELASIARRWINQCTWGHDHCRRTNKFHRLGQNLGEVTSNHPDILAWEVSLKIWAAEMENTPLSVISGYHSVHGTMIGHFTQLVWAETTKVGCAQVNYRRDSMFVSYLACNYGPAGNIRGNPVYKVGPPCSACPKGTSCGNIPNNNLCQDKVSIEEVEIFESLI